MSTTNIYILRLQGGRYYVGKSDNVMKRYEEHLNGSGSAWTKRYRPISLERTIENASPFDEEKITKEYMAKYGVDNVRGGAYVSEELSEIQREALLTELWAAQDRCTRCGNLGHFVSKCYAKMDICGNQILDEDDEEEVCWACEHCDAEFDSEGECERHERYCRSRTAKKVCFRCGRDSHYANDCYATSHVRGYRLS